MLHSHLVSDLGAALPLHISLSRPIFLVTENKVSFEHQLTETISSLNLKEFSVSPSELAWVSNFEGTRWFLVWKLNRPQEDALNKLLVTTNDVVSAFGQPVLYQTPSRANINASKRSRTDSLRAAFQKDFSQFFHISIAWSVTNPKSQDILAVKDFTPQAHGLDVHFDSVKVKIGNSISSIPLRTNMQSCTNSKIQ